jgi:hypothetical protein
VICPSLTASPMSQRAQVSEHIRARLPQLQPRTGDLGLQRMWPTPRCTWPQTNRPSSLAQC